MGACWYAVRVQSNREESIRDTLERQIKIEKLSKRVPEVLVPTESVNVLRGGKRQVVEQKLYPGYIFMQIELDEEGKISQDIWYVIRETSGVGDFIGGEEPWPLKDEEVAQMLGRTEERKEEARRLKIDFKEGDTVEVREGPFKNMSGRVDEVNQTTGRVKLIINIFNRSTPVELEYWQIKAV